MYSFLPDEILKEILSPALQISDKSFASTDAISPFAKYERSTSAYLLVCKDWLRVATPLLYNVVVLRSKAQIQALAWALKSTSELGDFIKKLRIECGYNTALSRVFQAAKNLTDLCLSLEIYSQDNVSGICQGLPSTQPHRVILYDPTRHTRTFNSRVIQLVEVLIGVIPTWSRLTTFVLPSFRRNDDRSLTHRFKRALCRSSSLQEIHCLDEYDQFIPEFAKIPTIKRILVPRPSRYGRMQGPPRLPPEVPRIVKEHPRLAQIVAFQLDVEEDNSLQGTHSSLAPPSVGLPSDWFQKCPTPVLENILFYAMGIPDLQGAGHGSSAEEEVFSRLHRQYLGSVCKKFREITNNFCAQHVVIETQSDLSEFVSLYSVDHEARNLAQSFFIAPYFYRSEDLDEDLAFVLSCCPNLRRVGYIGSTWAGFLCFSFCWGEFSALAYCSGHKLLDLEVVLLGSGPANSLQVFNNFNNLKNLSWNSTVTFTLGDLGIQKAALCSLETLACVTYDETFLRFIAQLNLPRIRSARFPTLEECPGVLFFLKKHGSKLQYLQTTTILDINIFETCPQLQVFSVPDDRINTRLHIATYPAATAITCSRNHPLGEIHLEVTVREGIAKDFFGFLGDLDLSSFTHLRRITISQCTWPSTEYEIRKSCWVPWAERLKTLYAVDVVDSQGKVWVPRLKVKGRRR